METLDQLESCISSLLSELDALRDENKSLKELQNKALGDLTEQNSALKNELEQERQRTKEALDRVDSIIQRLKERTVQE